MIVWDVNGIERYESTTDQKTRGHDGSTGSILIPTETRGAKIEFPTQLDPQGQIVDIFAYIVNPPTS